MSKFHTVPVWLLRKDEQIPYYPDGPRKPNGWRNSYYIPDGFKTVFKGASVQPASVRLPADFVKQLRLWAAIHNIDVSYGTWRQE